MKLRAAGVQILNCDAISPEERDANLERACNLIRKNPGYRLYLLPELSSRFEPTERIKSLHLLIYSGYDALTTFQHLDVLVEDAYSGPSFKAFSSVAKELKCFICYGIPRKVESEEKPKISHVILNDQGVVEQVYDKLHICQFGDCAEKNFFSRGSKLSRFSIDGIRFSLTICYDIRFPELFRKIALEEEIDVMLHPVGWTKDNSFVSWHPFVITRAIENQIYILSINRAGPKNGCSLICPPMIDWQVSPIKGTDEEQILSVEIDTDFIQQMRDEYKFRADRLPNYETLKIE